MKSDKCKQYTDGGRLIYQEIVLILCQAPDHFINLLKDLLDNPVLYPEEQKDHSDQAQEKVIKLPLKSDQARQQTSKEVTKQILESDQAKQLIESLNNKKTLIIQQLVQPRMLKELMEKVEQSHRSHFRINNYNR